MVPADGRRRIDFTQYSSFTRLLQLAPQNPCHRQMVRDFRYPATDKDNAA
jgi:hypothetical protein